MYKLATIAAIFGLGATFASASVISSSMTWVTGTLVSAVTVTAAAQTIELKVGTATESYPSTFLPGPVGQVYPAGTSMSLLEKGSSPFIATFASGLSLQALFGGGAINTRTVPISTTGAISDNIAWGAGEEAAFHIPTCNIGTALYFLNGIDLGMPLAMPSYTMTIPTGTTPALGSVGFPVGPVPNDVQFLGVGEGEMQIRGTAASTIVRVVGYNFLDAPVHLALATLIFTSGASVVQS